MSTAARLGIEPRLKASKASVLPLDDLAALHTNKEQIDLAPARRPLSATDKQRTN
jgi:hypothetical protein